MAITTPKLPPRAGYVEVEVDGERLYRNAATGVLLRDEEPGLTMEDLAEAALDLETRLLMLEALQE